LDIAEDAAFAAEAMQIASAMFGCFFAHCFHCLDFSFVFPEKNRLSAADWALQRRSQRIHREVADAL
jgi:hypothetical protein